MIKKEVASLLGKKIPCGYIERPRKITEEIVNILKDVGVEYIFIQPEDHLEYEACCIVNGFRIPFALHEDVIKQFVDACKAEGGSFRWEYAGTPTSVHLESE